MEEQNAYLAGLFDGEGCVAVYKNGRGTPHTLNVQIRQNVSPPVTALFLELQARFGGNFKPQDTYAGNRCYNWLLTGDKAANFLETILPYLRFKRDQAVVALDWYRSRPKMTKDARGRNQPLPPGTFEVGEEVNQLLRRMKRPLLLTEGVL